MSKISSVNKDRVSRMYVDRKTTVNGVSTVSKVDSVKPVHNEASSINDNFLLFAGSFYDKIVDLKKHYKEFYLNHQDLEDTMDKFKEKKDDESLEEIIIVIEELISKFNKTIKSLKNFETNIPNINFSKEIHETIIKYQSALNTIGIVVIEDETLAFNPSILKNSINFKPDCLFFLFDYQNGLIRKLFTIFRNIKVSTLVESNSYGEAPSMTSGMLIDNKY